MYQEDVGAEFEDAVDAGQLLEHDGVTDPTEELSDKLPDHQHHRGVQSHDATGQEAQEEEEEGEWLWYTDTKTIRFFSMLLLPLLVLLLVVLVLLLLKLLLYF